MVSGFRLRARPQRSEGSVDTRGRQWPAASSEPYPGDEQQARSTILVVQDEVLVRMMIADKLRSEGYTCLKHRTRTKHLKCCAIALTSGSFSDIPMPWLMDGAQLAGLVRSEYPVIKLCRPPEPGGT